MRYTLPYPPTVNTYWRSIGRGRVIISKEGRQYREMVCALLSGIQPAEGRLRMTIAAVTPDKRRRDLDNIPKALLDALKHAGAYEDDSQIDDLRIYRAGPEKPGRVECFIERLVENDAESLERYVLDHYS